MSTQSNMEASRRILEECFNAGKFDAVEEVCAPDIVQHDPATGDARGTDAVKQQIEIYRTAFPDIHMEIDDCFASGDEVVLRWHSEGTNDGAVMDMPATHKHAEVTGITIDKFDDSGHMTETWTQWDNLGMMQQLGFAGATGATGATAD